MSIAYFKKIFSIALLAIIVLVPGCASAHQPRIVTNRQTVVTNPEISKAYYGQLTGVPDVFTIQTNTPFNLYANILVPDSTSKRKIFLQPF